MYKNYFSLFKLDTHFSIDMHVLEQNYIELQSKHHPDLFLLKSEKKLALDNIAEINKAYETLRSSIKRAEYLLKIKGISTNATDSNNLIAEIFKIKESDNFDIQSEISSCIKSMENAFSIENFNEAAKQVTKLKYLRKIQEDRSTI